MQLINSSAEYIEQKPGIDGMLRHIELCARTCYKSEDRITDASAGKMVNMLINSGHTSCLEHGTVYLMVKEGDPDYDLMYDFFLRNPYSVVNTDNDTAYITTNYRVIKENDLDGIMLHATEPEKKHTKRITIKFICDRGVLAEFTRHRKFSFAAESSRYCDYSRGKFNGEITFICPSWMSIVKSNLTIAEMEFMTALKKSENAYIKLIDEGWKAQQARQVLPMALKTELCMTGTTEQWAGFFNLRCAPNAHPDARKLAMEARDIIANLYSTFSKQI